MSHFFLVLAIAVSLLSPMRSDAESAPSKASLLVQATTTTIRAGQEVTVDFKIDGVKDLFGAPFYVLFDPVYVTPLRIQEGSFLKTDKTKTAFLYKSDLVKGSIIVGLSRMGEVGGIDGAGTLMTATFKALRPGQTVISVDKRDFRNSRQEALPIEVHQANISIQK